MKTDEEWLYRETERQIRRSSHLLLAFTQASRQGQSTSTPTLEDRVHEKTERRLALHQPLHHGRS